MNILYIYSKIIKKLRGSAIKNSVIHHTSKVESGCQIINSSFSKHSFCGYDCSILNCDIGSFCSIANRVTIGGARHPIEFVSTSPVFLSHKDSVKTKFAHHDYLPTIKTIIDNDVWIGDGVFIKAGVHIGHGAVVGMGSVVTKNVIPYSIVAGNPAKLIRMRFNDKIINSLLKSQWWNKSDNELQEIAIYFDKIDEFLAKEGLV
jgi:chloramphenicol O-acetyltransferase type B